MLFMFGGSETPGLYPYLYQLCIFCVPAQPYWALVSFGQKELWIEVCMCTHVFEKQYIFIICIIIKTYMYLFVNKYNVCLYDLSIPVGSIILY